MSQTTSQTAADKRRTFEQLLAVMTIATAAAVLTACNTTEGAGKDVKALGQGIEEAAHDAND